MGVAKVSMERCVVPPLLLSLCGAGCMAGCRWWMCLFGCLAPSSTCTGVTQRHRYGLSPTWTPAFVCGGGGLGPGHVRALTACPLVGVACAAANQLTIEAAGGVEAIVQGMQAHLGVAGVQDHGAAALWNLAANNRAFLHRLWWRCVVCDA